MRNLLVSLMLLSSVTALCGLVATEPVPQIVLPAKVISVWDGDTPTCEVTFVMRVRLIDTWAPEVTGKQRSEGLKSKQRLEELALGKTGMLSIPLHYDIGKSTTLSRIAGRLEVDGRDVGKVMVDEGYATREKPKQKAEKKKAA